MKVEGSMELEDDQMCFACGVKNQDGLQLQFHLEGGDGIYTEFAAPKKFQGFKDIVHGGIIATIFDEVMVNLVYLRGIKAVTATLEVRLKKPARVGERLVFHGRIIKEAGRRVEARAVARNQEGTLFAEAKGLLVKV